MTDSFKAPQIALMHSRQLYCTTEDFTAESFTAWQKALMHSKQLQCTAKSFTAQCESAFSLALRLKDPRPNSCSLVD